MRQLLVIVALCGAARAQYTPPPPSSGPTLPLSQANGGTGSATGLAANAPWLCKPNTASTTAYNCSGVQLTLYDGTTVPSSLAGTPATGQQIVIIPDASNSGASTLQIDGATNINIKKCFAINSTGNLASSDLVAARVYTLAINAARSAWYIQGPGCFSNNDGSIVIAPTISNSIISVGPLPTINTATNCSSSASPAVCGTAAAGSIAFPTGVTSVALQVNTSAVTANSQIGFWSDDTLGTKLGVTCNSTLATLVGGIAVTARNPGVSFTLTFSGTIATNPLCASYLLVN